VVVVVVFERENRLGTHAASRIVDGIEAKSHQSFPAKII